MGEVWGQYNNYRANGLVGSGIVHVVLLGLILVGAAVGHQVVQQAKQREVVTPRCTFSRLIHTSNVLRKWSEVVAVVEIMIRCRHPREDSRNSRWCRLRRHRLCFAT